VILATDDCRISELIIRAGSSIDAISASYVGSLDKPYGTLKMGGNGGTEWVLQLGTGEFLVQLDGTFTSEVHWIQLTRNLNKGYSFGNANGVNFTYSAPPGFMIIGFWGGAGDVIDRLGVVIRTIPNSQ
jgi:Jacalin-like lectin domain